MVQLCFTQHGDRAADRYHICLGEDRRIVFSPPYALVGFCDHVWLNLADGLLFPVEYPPHKNNAVTPVFMLNPGVPGASLSQKWARVPQGVALSSVTGHHSLSPKLFEDLPNIAVDLFGSCSRQDTPISRPGLETAV